MGIDYKEEVLGFIRDTLAQRSIDRKITILLVGEGAESAVWIGPEGPNNIPTLYARNSLMYHASIIYSPEGLVDTLETEGRILQAYENIQKIKD